MVNNMNFNPNNYLQQIKTNPQYMNNQTVQNVFNCLSKRDHQGLVEIYKNTCQTLGQQPNQMFLQ